MDTKVVINELRLHECLRNPRNMYFKKETDKYKAWKELSVAVLPKYKPCYEYDERIVKAVQSSWKTARDAYMKCRQAEVKKPTNNIRQHRYIYQKKLKFLEQVTNTDESVNNKVRDDEKGSICFVGDNSASQSECQPGTSTSIKTEPLDSEYITGPPIMKSRNAAKRKLNSNLTEFERKHLKLKLLQDRIKAKASPVPTDDLFFYKSLTLFALELERFNRIK